MKRPPSDVRVAGEEGNAMWNSYHDILDESSNRHHAVGSAIVVLVVIGVLICIFA